MVRSITSILAMVVEPNNLRRLLDAFNLALTIHAVYYYLVVHFGGVDSLIRVVWYVGSTPSFTDLC